MEIKKVFLNDLWFEDVEPYEKKKMDYIFDLFAHSHKDYLWRVTDYNLKEPKFYKTLKEAQKFKL